MNKIIKIMQILHLEVRHSKAAILDPTRMKMSLMIPWAQLLATIKIIVLLLNLRRA